MSDTILKHALLNAADHDGKASIQAVVGKIIAEDPTVKSKLSSLMPEIKKIVEQVNSMKLAEQKKKIEEMGFKKSEKEKEEQGMPDLVGAEMGKVVMTFPPEPSKFLHIGHAKAAILNFLYSQRYKGTFILRFEDSNPELAKKEYYDSIMGGLKWLGIKWDKVDHISSHMDDYYKTVEKLIDQGHVYVCRCDQETVKKKREHGEICVHRTNSNDENMRQWKNMTASDKEGSATLRLKIDMNHQNTTMRDPVIARIIGHQHPLTKGKYRVWPTYDFGTSMMDVWEGITHRIRTKEFELRKELQQYIHKILGERSPETMEIGRFEIEGAITKGREIRDMISRGDMKGWDDPRLVTLSALRRRGFSPEGITNFILSTGMTKAESVMERAALEAANRKYIDKFSDRYFAVLDPVEITVTGLPKSVSVPRHPEEDHGDRKIPVSSKILVEKQDYESLENKKCGLMYLAKVNMAKKTKALKEEIKQEDPKIQWVPEKGVNLTIVMPDAKEVKGYGEPEMKKLKVDQTIQLVRIGFCRVDSNTRKGIVLYFSHK